MSIDAFIGAVKVKRDETLAIISERMENESGRYRYDDAIRDIDQLVGNVLDVVAERFEDFIEGSATDSEGEECTVSLTCSSELSTLYFEEVSS
jgi:hypothetical protein